jgi:hypothetical protein
MARSGPKQQNDCGDPLKAAQLHACDSAYASPWTDPQLSKRTRQRRTSLTRAACLGPRLLLSVAVCTVAIPLQSSKVYDNLKQMS